MKDRKTKTFVYHGLGFPITLVNVPLRKVLGHWVIDINMEELQRLVIMALVHGPRRLNKDELTFIRKYFEMREIKPTPQPPSRKTTSRAR